MYRLTPYNHNPIYGSIHHGEVIFGQFDCFSGGGKLLKHSVIRDFSAALKKWPCYRSKYQPWRAIRSDEIQGHTLTP